MIIEAIVFGAIVLVPISLAVKSIWLDRPQGEKAGNKHG